MDQEKTIPELKLTPEESKLRNFDIQTLSDMRTERDKKHPEIDDMTWTEYYESNRKKDLSYIPPKQSKNDIRIVTGTTREKDSTLLSALLDLNLEPNITAFDKDDLIVTELGSDMADMVKKSREIEQYDLYKSTIYREMISQGDVFVHEVYEKRYREMPIGKVNFDPTKDDPSIKKYEKRLKKVFEGCRGKMINAKHVYLGSMKIENIKDQPRVAVAYIKKRSQVQEVYGNWKRWQYVPYQVTHTDFVEDMAKTYKEWNLTSLQDGEICELFLYDASRNLFQIYLNGVPMLPSTYPLSAVSKSGEIPLSQGKLEPISGFALSKSQPSKTKVDQEVLDEATRLFIIAMRQTRKPPMGNSSNKVLGAGIFDAGKITPNIAKNTLFPLLPDGAQQINPSEFSFYQLFKDSISDKTVNDVYAGSSGATDVNTLGQAQQQKQQQVLKLGLAMDGVMNLEAQMTWNRIYNILENWTKPIDNSIDDVRGGIKSTYMNINVETTVDDGEAGIKMLRMENKEYPDVADQEQEEAELSKKHGKPVRIVYLNPDELSLCRHKWFVTSVPTPKSGDPIHKLMFAQMIQQAQQMFGPDAINQDYAKQRYAIINDENYKKLFVPGAILRAQQAQQAEMQNAVAGKEQVKGNKPLNTMVR